MMKRLYAALLALALMAAGCAALAEEPSLSEDQLGAMEIVPSPRVTLERREEVAQDMDGYSVVNDNEKYTIRTGDLVYSVDIAPYPTVVAMTRDYAASYRAYRTFNYDYVMSFFEANMSHLYLYDLETDNECFFYEDVNEVSSWIGDLTAMSAADRSIFISALSTDGQIYSIGNCQWIRTNEDTLLTVVGGRCVYLCYGSDLGPTEEDFADVLDLCQSLSIS